MKIYRERIERFSEDLASTKKKDRLYAVLRLILILGVLLLLYFAIAGSQWNLAWVAAGLFFLFLVVLFRHREVRQHSKKLRSFIAINENELEYLRGNFEAFNGGHEFLDHEHFYSRDLDLFGSNSLFQHLNRSATLKGKARLAKSLVSQQNNRIQQKQEAVKELSQDLDFRQKFRVEASLLDEDNELDSKLDYWQKTDYTNNAVTNPILLYLLSALAISALIYWLANPSLQSFYIFLAPATLNLLILGSQIKRIQREYGQLNGISKSVLMYGNLLRLIEERHQECEELKQVESGLEVSDITASKALQRLSKILDGFDQLNNVVGALIMNALFLYHLHVWRNLAIWKKRYSNKIGSWLAVVAEFDHYCSLANFAFNHVEYSYPKVTGALAYSANDLGHPLLAAPKRKVNSIDFEDFNYIILTGSNMSGKSTFLKTLGVNLVLAKAGAPVCASEMSFFPFKLLSSMNPEDSIQKEVSYFQAEVLRLRRIREEMEKGEPCFLLLDEILRGTNSDDKRNGTRLFMSRLTEFTAKGVIATHDIDIAELAREEPEIFEARYFESKFREGQLFFDYKLRKGVCTTPNATELMRSHGII